MFINYVYFDQLSLFFESELVQLEIFLTRNNFDPPFITKKMSKKASLRAVLYQTLETTQTYKIRELENLSLFSF